MSKFRRWMLTALVGAGTIAIALVAIAGIRHAERPRPARLDAGLALGVAFADSLERTLSSAPATSVSADEALAGLYLERLRLGLGSPFRLIDYALSDPLLPSSMKRLVANAILARTRMGRTYETSIDALDLLSPRPSDSMGLAHRRLIEHTLDSAASPRAAELALRLAYGISAAAGRVSHRAPVVAIGAIAQARDRALARRDVAALTQDARRQRMDPVDLVPIWRAARRFAVEAPLQDPPSRDDERAAVELMPHLVAKLDSMTPQSAPLRERAMGRPAAETAAELATRRDAPPQAPVVVTLSGYKAFVVGASRSPEDRFARQRFVSRARTEETLAAELLRLRATTGSDAEASLAALSAAVALRPYAQERAWLPGDDGPSLLEIQSRLGLAAVTFDSRVPSTWRPYYARMLDEVVADLTIVFPRLDLVGLHVHFGESPLRDRALALHDPSTRTIYFPLATSAGAMAHELAHDLDWQAARRRYGVRGGYRTDRSVRQYRDGLAASVRRMASAGRPERERSSNESPSPTVSERPTEAFARGVDWFVATALASRGRMDGYLSAVQDEVITGYASATAPRGGMSEGDATLDAIIEIAQVDPGLLAWYDAKYGTGRRFGVAEAVGRVLIAPLTRVDMRGSAPGLDGMSANIRALRSSPEAASGWACLLDAPSMRGRDAAVLRTAMTFAADERAHGLVTRWGDYARGQPDAMWRFRALGGAPWSPLLADSTWREVRDALLWRAARLDDGRTGLDLTERAERRAAWEACARR